MVFILRRRRTIALIMLMWGVFYLPVSSDATELGARVVGITDGDMITVITDQRRQLRVRLAEIDAVRVNVVAARIS